MKAKLWIIGLLILIFTEFLRVYFIMPFPGSQQWDTIKIAYFLHHHAWWLRAAGLLLLVYPAYQ